MGFYPFRLKSKVADRSTVGTQRPCTYLAPKFSFSASYRIVVEYAKQWFVFVVGGERQILELGSMNKLHKLMLALLFY